MAMLKLFLAIIPAAFAPRNKNIPTYIMTFILKRLNDKIRMYANYRKFETSVMVKIPNPLFLC